MNGFWIALLFLLTSFSGIAFTRDPSLPAASDPPPGPDRIAVITVEYTAYKWWMATWAGHKITCSVIVDHEGTPTPGEVYRDCGENVYETWIEQKPCVKQKTSDCEGYYIFPVESWSAEKEIAMQLAPATAWISLEDCEPVLSTSTNICESIPTLVITAREPLPNETITRVEGTYAGEPYACDGTDTCKFHLQETDENGVDVEFWAYSSYGDSSPLFTARVRVQQVDEGDPDQLYWYVDVLSTQWQGQAIATCAD